MNFLGIDPGLSGALVLLDQEGSPLSAIEMPTQPRSKGGNQIDAHTLNNWLISAHCNGEVTAFVEKVHAMPGQGVSSMFTFGEGCGVIRACLACRGIPTVYVTPQAWKKAFGLIGKEKDYARTVAAQMMPEIASGVARKKDIGKADAALIAYYGVRKFQLTGKCKKKLYEDIEP